MKKKWRWMASVAIIRFACGRSLETEGQLFSHGGITGMSQIFGLIPRRVSCHSIYAIYHSLPHSKHRPLINLSSCHPQLLIRQGDSNERRKRQPLFVFPPDFFSTPFP
ncbi:hypothetical protein HDK64DRAFT_12734 [Phyllosticta capitalensis]